MAGGMPSSTTPLVSRYACSPCESRGILAGHEDPPRPRALRRLRVRRRRHVRGVEAEARGRPAGAGAGLHRREGGPPLPHARPDGPRQACRTGGIGAGRRVRVRAVAASGRRAAARGVPSAFGAAAGGPLEGGARLRAGLPVLPAARGGPACGHPQRPRHRRRSRPPGGVHVQRPARVHAGVPPQTRPNPSRGRCR